MNNNLIRKRALSVYLLTICTLAVFSISVFITKNLTENKTPIFISFAILVISIILHNLAKKHNYIYLLSIILSYVSTGVIAGAYYGINGLDIDLQAIACGAFTATIIGTVLLIFWETLPRFSNVVACISLVITLAVTIFSTVQRIRTGELVYGFCAFCLIILFFNFCAMFSVVIDIKINPLRSVSFAGYGAFAIIGFIVLLLLSEGDILDGADVATEGAAAKKENKKSKL